MKDRSATLQNEPLWLPIEEVVEINRDVTELTSEPFLLKDQAGLESALDRARNHFAYSDELDLVTLAVEILVGIARNHPFLQGNKRTALTAALLFIETNGYRCDIDDSSELLGRIITDLLEGNATEQILVTQIRKGIRIP